MDGWPYPQVRWSAMRIALFLLGWVVAANAQPRSIDKQNSTMTVHVLKAGVLSAFGHDHEIAAPVARGAVDVAGHQVELHVEAGALKVRDPKASDEDRAKIQTTMLGPEVLDATRYPEIGFQSTKAERLGDGSWKLSGSLMLHGQTKPITVQVREKNGHYVGQASLKQTDFGIKPIRVGGGAVRVKDELRIEFNIQLTPLK